MVTHAMAIAKELIDSDADKILRRLRRNGHAAFLVGGCVRDLLLGRTPKDFDIATSATPNEIKDLFRNCRIIGRRFRLAHIFFGQKIIETATFRANPREGVPFEEGEELLIRRDNVFGTAEEDARRRDFTINGLFYDIEACEVTDYVGGLADLDARLIRTIGDPDIRFREDPVRILRAIKFAARLDFNMEPVTYAALLAHRGEIPKCAPPRVLEEIYRLLRGGAARRSMELLLETGVAATLAPELVWMFSDGANAGTPLPPGLPRDENDRAVCRTRAWRVLDELDAAFAPPPGRKPRKAEIADDGVPVAATGDGAIESENEDRPALPSPPPVEMRRRRYSEVAGTNALLLAALVLPFLPEPPPATPDGRRGPDSPREQTREIEELLGPLAQRLRVSRRDGERARQILLAQRRLSPVRRRRSRPLALAQRDYFGEALLLYEILGAIRQNPSDDVGRWRALWRTAQSGTGHAPEAAHGPAHSASPARGPGSTDRPGAADRPSSTDRSGAADRPSPSTEDEATATAPGQRRRRRRGGRGRRRGVPTSALGDTATGAEATAPSLEPKSGDSSADE